MNLLDPAQVRALSIRQPWAGLILAGVKHTENRTWTTNYRGLLVIHAGRQPDQHAPLGVRRAAQLLPICKPTGYIGLATLTDVHPDAGCCRPFGEHGTYHWTLTDPHPFPGAVPGPGRLGLYRAIPHDVIALTGTGDDQTEAPR